MEFLDEDAKPKFTYQSGAPAATESHPYEKPTKPFLFVTISLSSIFFALALFIFQSEPFKSILFWFSLSLLIGPFAPSSITAGDFRVGRGHAVNFPDQDNTTADDDDDGRKRSQQRRSKQRRSEDVASVVVPALVASNGGALKNRNGNGNGGALKAVVEEEEEKEWNEDDIEILKKQLVKNPVGKPGRWEAISEAFGGRHRVESVVKTAKSLGEKKVDDSDSYEQFLKKRKALDKRLVEDGGEGELGNVEKVEGNWSSNEDIALLNALKAFPKDVAMRWEKVAAAVPGKSKAGCMKRIAELKKGFRTAKSASDV